MSEQVNITFKIKNISTLEFTIKNIPELNKINKDLIDFQVSAASFVELNNSVVGFDIIVDVFLDNSKQKKICNLISRLGFEVINLNDFFDSVSKKVNLPTQFLQTLLSISISTARGILATKTEGTYLRDIYLPVMNPSAFKPVDINKTP